MKPEPRNILLIKPGAIGDLLQLTPVIRALRQRFPGARVTVMTSGAGTASLFAHHPDVAATMVFDRKGAHRSWRAFAELWRQVRRQRFDLVVNFQRSTAKAWLLVMAALPCRQLVYHKAKWRTVHAVVNHLEAVAPLGIDPAAACHDLLLVPGPEAEVWADGFLVRAGLDGTRLVALNVGASHGVNRWPAHRFAELADLLTRDRRLAVVLVGGDQDRELAAAVRERLTNPVTDLTGSTTLLQLGALLQRCRVVVSADTGPLHLATAVGTPTVALFGAADPARTGPVGDGHVVLQADGPDCVPCRSRRCRHEPPQECMERITADAVADAVARLLARPQPDRPGQGAR